MLNSAASGFLDHFDSLSPCSISQSVQNLLESGTILGVSRELSRHEQIFVRADKLVIGELDEVFISTFFEDQR